MFAQNRAQSVQFPRPKIYLSHLNQLIGKKEMVVQPQIEVSNKLFPQRNFAKKLATSHQRTKSSIQLRSQKFDLHWTTKRTRQMLAANTRPVEPPQSNKIRLELPRTMSNQLHSTSRAFKDEGTRFCSTHTGMPQSSSPEGQSASNPSSPQKNFLRRGSNIHKQIVINLLRNKMLRQREMNEKKQYSNCEIIQMIQVFKGVVLEEGSKKAPPSHDSRAKCLKERKIHPQKDIRGWENEPFHDFQLQSEKD